MHQRRDIFICDRCSERQSMPAGEQPPGWWRVMCSFPVLANPLEVDRGKRSDKILCASCSTDLDRWLRSTTWVITHERDAVKSS